MDQAAINADDSVIFTKKVAVWAAFAVFALESFITFRQARLNDHQSKRSVAKDGWSDSSAERSQDLRLARAKMIFRATNASGFMLLVIMFMKLDIAPWLWVIVGNFQTTFLPSFTGEFVRSCLFVLLCALLYLALNSVNFILRSIVLKENVLANLAASWNSTLRLHELARGNVMPTVLLFTTVVVLFSQALGIPLPQHRLVLWYFIAQMTFVIAYPMAIRPKQKHLSLMEQGSLNEELTKLGSSFVSTLFQKVSREQPNLKPKNVDKLKLQNIYISDGPMPRDIEDGIQTFGWWPKKKHLVIHRIVMQQCTPADILALTAQQLGCWTYANNLREFLIAQTIISHAVAVTLIFIRQKASYMQFNFPPDVYPKVAGLLIFAIGFAPIIWLYFTLQMNFIRRKLTFLADKYAADLGYSTELSVALTKIPAAANEMKIDWLYSWYHNASPQISERLEALEKLREKEEGAISLPPTIDEKV